MWEASLVNMVRPALLEDSVLAAASQGVVDVAALTRGLPGRQPPRPVPSRPGAVQKKSWNTPGTCE